VAACATRRCTRATGLPVTGLNIALAVLTAVTVVVSMRVVGLLLISALMIVPNATAQLLGRSFRTSVRWAVLVGVLSSVGGVVISYYAETPSGGTIVLLAIAVFACAAAGTALAARLRAHQHREAHHHEHGPDCGHPMVAHGDHVDYLHDGHRHAPHEGHYDEHGGQADTARTPEQEVKG
jgi:zinc transport system permease protein